MNKNIKKIAFILLFLPTILLSKNPKYISLIVSGGASLGSYEAGYNWAFVKSLKFYKTHHKNLNLPTLYSAVGASAGSINALLSAITWCKEAKIDHNSSVENNLFKYTWLNLGLDSLLPIDSNKYHNSDTIFSRRQMLDAAQKILNEIYQAKYDNGCEVKLGFSVTAEEPRELRIGDVTVENQSFYIPTLFKTKNRHANLYNIPIDFNNMGIERVILESSLTKKPKIDQEYPLKREDIKKSLIASAAFPLAFSKVNIKNCIISNRVDNSTCPEGFLLIKDSFVDGGVFNNVPVNIGIDLEDKTLLKDGIDYFIIKPSYLRYKKIRKRKKEKKFIDFGITGQLKFLPNAVETSQVAILYQTLKNANFNNGNSLRYLKSSDRFGEITGNLLAHFGAFFEKEFREIDYYAGVYNGVQNFARYLCKRFDVDDQRECESKWIYQVFKDLRLDDDILCKISFKFLSSYEYGVKYSQKFADDKIYNKLDKQKLNNYTAIIMALKSLDEDDAQDVESFPLFVSKLKENGYIADTTNTYLTDALQNPRYWQRLPLQHIINRLVYLEKMAYNSSSLEAYPTAIGGSSYFLGTTFKDKMGFRFSPTSIPSFESKKIHYKLFPYDFGFDLSNGGVNFGWEPRYYFEHNYKSRYEKFESIAFKSSFNFGKDSSDDAKYFRQDISFRYKLQDDRLILAGGPSLFVRFNDGQMRGGYNIYLDIADVVRLGYIYKLNADQISGYLQFSIQDFPGLYYWVFSSF